MIPFALLPIAAALQGIGYGTAQLALQGLLLAVELAPGESYESSGGGLLFVPPEPPRKRRNAALLLALT